MSKLPLLFSFALGCFLGFGGATLRNDAPERSPAIAVSPSNDVHARAKAILNGDDPLTRLTELGKLLETSGPEHLADLREAFEYAPLDGGDPELVMMGLWWAHFDPEAAFLWTSSDWRAQYGSVIAAVFRVWGSKDPQRAFELARGIRFSGQREIATDATIAGWEESGRPGLMAFIQSLTPTDQQRMSEIIARRRVVKIGPEEALRWADSLEQPTLRGIMSLRVASAAAAVPHGAPFAAKWAEPVIASADRPTGYPRRIGTRWIKHDPEGAMAWLKSLPEGGDRDDGVLEAYRDWHRRDPVTARAWVREGGMERWNEPAHSIYARLLAREQPKEALALARSLSDEKLRRQTTIKVGRVWTENDAEAAKAWFAQSGLPEDLIKKATSSGSTPRRERLRAERAKAAQPKKLNELD